jgi:ParB family transcriptional regulator, chromosome partitioning protein
VARPMPGMGRGLEAILSASSEEAAAPAEHLRQLPVDRMVPNPRQPRRRFEAEALQSLASSIADQGLLQPVLVRPLPGGSYELIAGERRWRAAQLAGRRSIPALVRPREDAETLELALIENMAREDLNPVEAARACAVLVEELALTREQVGRRVGRSRVAISNLIRLLDLPDDVLELLAIGTLSEGHGRALLMAEDHGERSRLARECAREGWSVRVLEARARESNGEAPRARITVRRGRVAHPDQVQAAEEIGATLEAALGAEVRVTPKRDGGFRAELTFQSADEAAELARRVRPRAAA